MALGFMTWFRIIIPLMMCRGILRHVYITTIFWSKLMILSFEESTVIIVISSDVSLFEIEFQYMA